MVQRQFTLRRLFVNVTLFCVILAFATKFPEATRSLTLFFILYAPTLALIAFACFVSKRRARTSAVVGTGALLGWYLSPRICVLRDSPPTFWDSFMVEFMTVGIFTAEVAFVFAFLEWMTAPSSPDELKRHMAALSRAKVYRHQHRD